MKRKNRHLSLQAVLIFFWALNGAVAAQENKEKPEQIPAQQETGQKSPQQEAPAVDDQSIKLFLDKIEVEGRLEKPQAVFIIPGTNPEIDDIRIERSFFEEIFRPIEKKGRAITRPAPELDTNRKDVIPW